MLTGELTYLKIFLRSFLHFSKRSTAVEFSEMRSFSLLMDCRVFIRFVEAMDASAIVLVIWSFSASRLNGLCFLDLLLLFFDLSLADRLEE